MSEMTASEASALVRAEKEHRRAMREEYLRSVVSRNPGGKLARRATALWLDVKIRDEFIADHGGDEGATQWLCWRVAGGETLEDIAVEHSMDYGCLWEWVSRDEERLARYYRAQRGSADALVAQAVPIADETPPEEAAHGKLRVETRLKVAAKLDRERFGERDTGITIDMRDRRDPAQLRAEMSALLASNPELKKQFGDVLDVVAGSDGSDAASAANTQESGNG